MSTTSCFWEGMAADALRPRPTRSRVRVPRFERLRVETHAQPVEGPEPRAAAALPAGGPGPRPAGGPGAGGPAARAAAALAAVGPGQRAAGELDAGVAERLGGEGDRP